MNYRVQGWTRVLAGGKRRAIFQNGYGRKFALDGKDEKTSRENRDVGLHR
jgi:hypothetical protein